MQPIQRTSSTQHSTHSNRQPWRKQFQHINQRHPWLCCVDCCVSVSLYVCVHVIIRQHVHNYHRCHYTTYQHRATYVYTQYQFRNNVFNQDEKFRYKLRCCCSPCCVLCCSWDFQTPAIVYVCVSVFDSRMCAQTNYLMAEHWIIHSLTLQTHSTHTSVSTKRRARTRIVIIAHHAHSYKHELNVMYTHAVIAHILLAWQAPFACSSHPQNWCDELLTLNASASSSSSSSRPSFYRI